MGGWIVGWDSQDSPWSPPSKREDEQTVSAGMRIFYNQVKLISWKLQQFGSKDIPVQHPQILQAAANVIGYPLELCSKAPLLKPPIIGLQNMEKSTGTLLEASFLLVSFHGAGKCCAHHKRIKVIISLTQAWSLQATIMPGARKKMCNSGKDTMEVIGHFLVEYMPHSRRWNIYLAPLLGWQSMNKLNVWVPSSFENIHKTCSSSSHTKS